jgi:hypothetical protein
MRSRQVIRGLFLMAGIAVVALLIMPAVHVPFIVVHGPMSALRAQRAAWVFKLLIQMAALTIAALCVRFDLVAAYEGDASLNSSHLSAIMNCVRRC